MRLLGGGNWWNCFGVEEREEPAGRGQNSGNPQLKGFKEDDSAAFKTDKEGMVLACVCATEKVTLSIRTAANLHANRPQREDHRHFISIRDLEQEREMAKAEAKEGEVAPQDPTLVPAGERAPKLVISSRR